MRGNRIGSENKVKNSFASSALSMVVKKKKATEKLSLEPILVYNKTKMIAEGVPFIWAN